MADAADVEVLEWAEGDFHAEEATNEEDTIVVAILLAVDIVVATEAEPEAIRRTEHCRGVGSGVYWYSMGSDC